MAISALNHLANARELLGNVSKLLHNASRRREGLDVLAGVINAQRYLAQAEQLIVLDAREEGTTWAAIGDVYGVTRQAARQRFTEGAE